MLESTLGKNKELHSGNTEQDKKEIRKPDDLTSPAELQSKP